MSGREEVGYGGVPSGSFQSPPGSGAQSCPASHSLAKTCWGGSKKAQTPGLPGPRPMRFLACSRTQDLPVCQEFPDPQTPGPRLPKLQTPLNVPDSRSPRSLRPISRTHYPRPQACLPPPQTHTHSPRAGCFLIFSFPPILRGLSAPCRRLLPGCGASGTYIHPRPGPGAGCCPSVPLIPKARVSLCVLPG